MIRSPISKSGARCRFDQTGPGNQIFFWLNYFRKPGNYPNLYGAVEIEKVASKDSCLSLTTAVAQSIVSVCPLWNGGPLKVAL
jgi:hypothetical protein